MEVPGGDLLSESPPPGAVQVPPSGAPILLLADRRRSAGYDKPAVIHPDDLALAGPLEAGERLRFCFRGRSFRALVRRPGLRSPER